MNMNLIRIILVGLAIFTSSAAYAADAAAVPEPLKATIEKSVNVKEGSGDFSILWDNWRNDVMKAVWAKFCILLEGGDAVKIGPMFLKVGMAPKPQFPQGIGATYSFSVAADRKIKDVKIESSSGDSKFDAMIKKSIESLEGKRLLDFPVGTHRTDVFMMGRLITKKNGKFRSTDYNDVERIKSSEDAVEELKDEGNKSLKN